MYLNAWIKHSNVTDVTGIDTFNFSIAQSITQIGISWLVSLINLSNILLYLMYLLPHVLALAEFRNTIFLPAGITL